MVAGLGNPGPEYAGTRHNVGFAVVRALTEQWDLGRPRERYAGTFVAGRIPRVGDARPPRVALLAPQTFYNDAGRSVGPARGALKVELEHVIVVHDEIDLPFGDVRARLGGGLAGNNGLRSIRKALGSEQFMRVRVGVGRPHSTDPAIVASYVLSRFRESDEQVRELIADAARQVDASVRSED